MGQYEITTPARLAGKISHLRGQSQKEFWGEPAVSVIALTGIMAEVMKDQVRSSGAKLVEVAEPIEICKDAFSTGELGTSIKEQALFVKSGKGPIVITGCAHPGIVEIVRRSKEIGGGDIHLAIGGFHLVNKSPEEVRAIAEEIKGEGVDKAFPCHCSGDAARAIFSEIYGRDFIPVGVGSSFEVEAASDNSSSENTSWGKLKRG